MITVTFINTNTINNNNTQHRRKNGDYDCSDGDNDDYVLQITRRIHERQRTCNYRYESAS